MKDYNIKEIVDEELNSIYITDQLRKKIKQKCNKRNEHRVISRLIATLAIFLLSGTTVLAGVYVINHISINGEELPELDEMAIVNHMSYETGLDEDGYVSKNYSSYDAIQCELNIELLDTTLFEENDWMHGNVYTDNTDFMIIKLENYILEDMENYSYDSAEGYYRYYNAISLEINIILSEEQLAYGWDTEYLGLYQFVENYVSEQGYKVNLLEDTLEDSLDATESTIYISEKCAVFVADGMQYTLKGRVSEDTMKEIVDSMMY